MVNLDQDIKRKLSRFEEEIMDTVAQRCKEIDDEIQTYHMQELGKHEDDILTETYAIIQTEVQELSELNTKELSRNGMELKKRLYLKRDEYSKLIFAQARIKLADFASSPEYEAFLLAKAKKLAEYNLDGAELHVKQCDLNYADALSKICAVPVVADEKILIGGALLVNTSKNFVVDETLDTALEDQKEWFADNSGFIVAM